MALPKDPIMLLSYINTQLRDYYPSLAELCSSLDVERTWLEETLLAAGYRYEESGNQFR